jgi:hypothetical protein
MSYEIDPLEEKDVAESIKLLQTLGSPISTIFSNSDILKRTLYGPHAITLVAKEDGKIAGVVHGTATMPPNIVLLATKPSATLGSMLIDKFVDHVRNQFPSANAVRTSLPADMTEIVAFYSSKGFIVEGFVKGGIQNRDLIFLRKPLTRQTTPVT